MAVLGREPEALHKKHLPREDPESAYLLLQDSRSTQEVVSQDYK